MTEHSDLKSYYRVLGASTGASVVEIRRAYRRLAKELHPDRHPNDPAATAKFQALNEAHGVLSNPEARARYDAACLAADTSNVPRQQVEPITCSSCGAVSAQPRYVIFWYVISVILVTHRRTMQGVFCPSCAANKAVECSAITWLLGWWGFPWGPLWTLGALYRNLLNGTQPADVNAQILGRQALYFLEKGKPDLAAAAVYQALRLKISGTLREHLSELKLALPATPKAQLIDRWKLMRGWGFWAQLAPALAVAVVMAVGNSTSVYTNSGTPALTSKSSVIYGEGLVDPRRARCLPSGPVDLTNGTVFRQTTVGPHTLKTTNGSSYDAVVKLRDMTGHTALSFYVGASGYVAIQNVPEGTFSIEFATGRDYSPVCGYFLRNMSSRRFVNQEIFATRLEGNYRYTSVLEITLNPVPGGTARTVSIDGIAFDPD